MAVVSEKKWMERFVINLDVICSNGLASGDDPARRSSDVGSDVGVIQDPIPTAVSMRTVVTEEWMDRFVLDLVECPSVSRTSAVARTFGPAVSEEYSPVVFPGGGGEVADAYPLVVVEPDTVRVSGLQLVKSDTSRVSALPVAGCKFPAVFWGKVALDVVSLGVGPPCLRVDSEETLLTLTDERAQSVLELITPSDWPVSAGSTSDWVTPLRTSPRTSLSSLLRECGSDAGLSLSNDSRPELRLTFAIHVTQGTLRDMRLDPALLWF